MYAIFWRSFHAPSHTRTCVRSCVFVTCIFPHVACTSAIGGWWPQYLEWPRTGSHGDSCASVSMYGHHYIPCSDAAWRRWCQPWLRYHRNCRLRRAGLFTEIFLFCFKENALDSAQSHPKLAPSKHVECGLLHRINPALSTCSYSIANTCDVTY